MSHLQHGKHTRQEFQVERLGVSSDAGLRRGAMDLSVLYNKFKKEKVKHAR